jgi:RNA polymerase sigma-70 factor, ECF subfamily
VTGDGPGGPGGPGGLSADPPDPELLAAHIAGDPQAFGVLVQRHRDRLWAVALRTMGNPDDAADAVQDAFVSAYRSAGTFRGEAAVTTWLHRIVVNACLDRIRRAKARPTVPLPEPDGLQPADPRDTISARETAVVVAQALAALPDEQRLALVLVDMQGYSVEETAQILDCAAGTVKSRCARGRAKLQPLLAGLRNPDTPTGVPPGSVSNPRGGGAA